MATAEARRKEDEARAQDGSPGQRPGRSRRGTRQLDFFQAMADFKNMFPTLDDDVIEAVLRANDGAVDATIDQLLTMTIDEDMSCVDFSENTEFKMPQIPSYDEHELAAIGGSEDSPPSYSEAMRTPPGLTNQTQSIWTTPIAAPKLPSRNQLQLEVDSHLDSQGAVARLNPAGLPKNAGAGLGFSPHVNSVQRSNSSDSQTTSLKKEFRNWNPPMLGNLPDDFLRLMLPETKLGTPSAKSDIDKTANLSATPVSVMSMTDTRPKIHKGRSKSEKLSRSFSMGTKETKDKDSVSKNSDKKNKSSEKISRSFSLVDGSHKSVGARHKDRGSGLSSSQSRNHSVIIETHDFSKDMLQERIKENERRRQNTSAHFDPELAQYLEDERLALALQNSEFLQELRSNDDFMKTLEKERVSAKNKDINSSSSPSMMSPALRPPDDALEGYGDDSDKTLGAFPFSQPVAKDKDEDAELRRQLNGMGKASKKQLASLARKFFKRKKKNSKQILGEKLAPSMMNLLEDEDEEGDEDLNLDSRYGNSPTEIEPLPSNLIGVPSHRTVQRPAYRPDGVTTYFDNKHVDMV